MKIVDYHTFNPAKTGIYALAYARSLAQLTVPKSGQTGGHVRQKLWERIKSGSTWKQGLHPPTDSSNYTPGLDQFKKRKGKLPDLR